MIGYRLAAILLVLGLLLTGCETLRGAERDLQQGSNWFERKVEEAR
jgi:predicted small secreted protein